MDSTRGRPGRGASPDRPDRRGMALVRRPRPRGSGTVHVRHGLAVDDMGVGHQQPGPHRGTRSPSRSARDQGDRLLRLRGDLGRRERAAGVGGWRQTQKPGMGMEPARAPARGARGGRARGGVARHCRRRVAAGAPAPTSFKEESQYRMMLRASCRLSQPGAFMPIGSRFLPMS